MQDELDALIGRLDRSLADVRAFLRNQKQSPPCCGSPSSAGSLVRRHVVVARVGGRNHRGVAAVAGLAAAAAGVALLLCWSLSRYGL